LIAAALVAPALLIGGAAFDNHAARGVLIFIAITSGALVLLVIARMIGFVRVAERSIRLAEHNKRLIELDAVKDDVIAIVSHELRTPLTSIVGYLEFVLEDPDALTKEQQKFLGVVDRNANRLLGLVSDLLFVAQVQAGRMALEKDALNFPELVREAVAAALPSATERRVQIDLNRCDGETEILGDRKRLAQVVDNLLSNALKFTPAGGVVEVRLLAEDESVALEVADTGIGIPAAEQQKLFTRFFRTEAAMKKAIQGTGLGLSIVKAIVEGHGGEITVVSAANRGATFRVVLPRAAAVAPESFREAA
jgi:signal transduction histidine kinase